MNSNHFVKKIIQTFFGMKKITVLFCYSLAAEKQTASTAANQMTAFAIVY